MSLIPALTIGIWNAWIFVPAFLFFHGVAVLVWLLLGYDLKYVFKKASGEGKEYTRIHGSHCETLAGHARHTIICKLITWWA